ncbi:hypothetical protein OG196_14120 [Kitasatospora purpeofusca]|uniref:hypothetical protein n=1 Tax=Kitasatospora purpeofusca TaxID=67352 RepID=UPI002E142D44|nr:hypothetical protein OG196_14120 [Kitasatospora purpeofusca]
MFTALPDTDVCMPSCYRDPRFSPAEGAWKDKKSLTDLCRPVLAQCTPCPFRAKCIRQVQPYPKKFDGVCGGRLWLDGLVIDTANGVSDDDLPAPGKPRPSCGTTAGVAGHQVRGEQQCQNCAAFTEAEAERAAAEAESAELPVAA